MGNKKKAPTEEAVYRQIRPESCEWLLRPKVAMSEFSDTVQQNLNTLQSSPVQRFKEHFAKIEQHLLLLNSRESGQVTSTSIKDL